MRRVPFPLILLGVLAPLLPSVNGDRALHAASRRYFQEHLLGAERA